MSKTPPAEASHANWPFNPENVARAIIRFFERTPESTDYVHRWSLSRWLGLGLERRGGETVTAFTGGFMQLGSTGLLVEPIQTSKTGNYGLNSNVKLVPGCEPGKVVQKISLRTWHDVDVLLQALHRAAGR